MSNYEGNLITVEGLDKSGKSTLIDGLKEERPEFEFTAEPSNGKYGRIVREELQSGSDPNLADFYLFLADRFDHCQSLIGPLLEQGETVVCDRYQLSTFAYQSRVVREDCNLKHGIGYISDLTQPWLIVPDLTIYPDIPVEVALDRKDGDGEKYETRERLTTAKRVYDRFHANHDHIKKIDGLAPEEDVLDDALMFIRNLENE